MSDFDPNSTDAMFAKVLAELAAVRATQSENAIKQERSNLELRNLLDTSLQRIASLEAFKIWMIGMSAGVSAVVGIIIGAAKWIFVGTGKQ